MSNKALTLSVDANYKAFILADTIKANAWHPVEALATEVLITMRGLV